MKRHTASSPHESRINWRFTEHGLSPYWALASFIGEFDGGFTDDVVDLPTGPDGENERGLLSFGYHEKGKIAPREQDARDPDKPMWEINVKWRGPAEAKASFAIKPRWDGLSHIETDNRITTPFDHLDASEGVYVQVQGSNREFDDYPRILRACCQGLAELARDSWNTNYFRTIGDGSIGQHERYYRTHRDVALKLTDQDGIFAKLQNLYAAEEGTHVTLDINNKKVQGYQNRIWLPNHSVDPIPGLEHGVKLENYHPEHVQEDGALAHPKVEALFKLGNNKQNTNPKLNGETVDWENRDQLVTELEEFLINVHRWVGVDVDPDAGTFVEDDHFVPTASSRQIERYGDPTPEIEATRESALVRTLADAKDRDVEALKTVVADGGSVHYQDLADELGSVSTVYRALEQLKEVVENQNGTISFVCSKIHEDLRDVFDVAEGAVEYARKATEKMLRLSDDRLSSLGGALEKWVKKYGVEIKESSSPHRDHVIKINSMLSRYAGTDLPFVEDVVYEGWKAWNAAGLDGDNFDSAEVRALNSDGQMEFFGTAKALQ